MKKELLLMMFVLLSSLSFGQELYRPFLEDGKVWTYHYFNDFTGHEFYVSLAVIGDTIIDNKSYKKIVDVATGNYRYGMREEEKKVYCAFANNAETLLYDFGLKIGDSFYMSDDNPNPNTQATVVAVDTIVVGTRAFRVLDIRLNSDSYWANWWVEGIGGLDYLTANFPKVGNFYSFSSCQLNGETIFTHKDFWTVGIRRQPYMANKETPATFHNLLGRHLNTKPSKGVYIQDGKKYMVK